MSSKEFFFVLVLLVGWEVFDSDGVIRHHYRIIVELRNIFVLTGVKDVDEAYQSDDNQKIHKNNEYAKIILFNDKVSARHWYSIRAAYCLGQQNRLAHSIISRLSSLACLGSSIVF